MPGFEKYYHLGWAVYSTQQPVIDNENRSWQLYVSVKPSNENLEKALYALDMLVKSELALGNYKFPTIKVALPEDCSQHQHYFDAALPPPSPSIPVSDQDQMGREICVALDYNSLKRNYALNPSDYKVLMLKIWRALEKCGVEINYITPDIDEMTVNCDREILTPFSYSARKNPLARHGLLLAGEANPNLFDDPLLGLRITRKDLDDYDIKGGVAPVVCFKRIDYLSTRLERIKKPIREDITAFLEAVDQEPNCQTVLQKLNDILAIKDNDAFINACTGLYNNTAEWLPLLPRKPTTAMDPVFNIKEAKLRAFRLTDIPARIKALREQLQMLVQFTTTEIENIKKYDFQTGNMENLEEQKKQDRAIERHPAIAQRLFRRLVHIDNVEKRLIREQERMISEFKFPEAYQQIWDQTPGGLLTKSRALLRDYTKDSNPLILFFTGHWGRSPAQIIEVQRILDNDKELNDFEKLMSRMYEIPLKDSGSLGQRLAFILQKYFEQLKGSKENKPAVSYHK